MDTRRDFIKKAALLAGTAGIRNVLPSSVQKALAINPDQGSTFYDAEHIVLLMQENRSFDHCFGTLRGVRGYNDPQAITLPDQNLVWLQSNKKGETYAPFRLNIKDTKATWMSSLPHSWTNQLPYQMYAEGKLSQDKKTFEINMRSGHEIFGSRTAGVPFKVYEMKKFHIRDYAVAPGAQITDQWNMVYNDQQANYHFRIYGPNGFFREYTGNGQTTDLNIQCEYERKSRNKNKLTGNITLYIENPASGRDDAIVIRDNGYKAEPITKLLKAGNKAMIVLDLKRSFGWYDFTVSVPGNKSYSARYAGHVETGEDSFSDPVMGKIEI
jgi:hypothetical protein